MTMTTLGQLAKLVQGTVVGNGQFAVSGAATLADATEHDISFVDHAKLRDRIAGSSAAAVLIPEDWSEVAKPAIRVAQVRSAFAAIVNHFRPPYVERQLGISPLAQIDASAVYGENCEIHPGAVVGPEVVLGDRVTLHANVVIMGRCHLGNDVTIFPARCCIVTLKWPACCDSRECGHRRVWLWLRYDPRQTSRGDQLGYVILQRDVEIGANSTIDRGTYGPTIIGTGSKIDNLVMIAHNCRIGRHNLICSQVGIAGSSTTGDYVVMAGQVGVPDHVKIGNRAILGAKAGIMRDVPDDITVLGIPATPERDQLAKQAAFAKLPEMRATNSAISSDKWNAWPLNWPSNPV